MQRDDFDGDWVRRDWCWMRALRDSLPVWIVSLGVLAWALPGRATALPEAARAAVERLVQAQTAGLPGKASVSYRTGANLPDCASDFEAFMPTGQTPWGRVSIGLRCRDAQPWTRYVAANVVIQGTYYVAARAMSAGEALLPGDYVKRTGDLSALPRSIVTDTADLEGVTVSQRIAAGAPLRKDLMRGVVVIQQGQTVQVVAQGAGFAISTEGKAMTQAEAGEAVRARTRDGRLVTGVADADGRIHLAQ
ncbi:flagellar basal body P-ring formation chaperone FlgA [Variovorax dokdonensis]|uniref:Flagella basal body P-ring formation protein FlgA n=1 Tax=Variovorax dokdonensis TaxID=344883 RepID=A0ABT7N4S3_9BURK|nr:flagellar basal body P-ring formation chaperone FlgA [Variovorax dokdonensis]MDM0042931.1 flagellar basal body P-ring formation chaperone FlgA [Variovorax dokdonensis]